MKTLFTTLIILLSVTIGYGQITTTKVAPKVEHLDSLPYDSTKNFLGNDVHKYIGQELYVKGKAIGLRVFGYEGFVKDYTKNTTYTNKPNIYKCCDNSGSKYSDLEGKYFTVLDVIKHPNAEEDKSLYGSKYFLKLKEKENGDVVYFVYDARYEHNFPFIVVGYFTKLKSTEVGKEFIVRGRNWIEKGSPMLDMNTGKPVSNFEAGGKWKCVDITIEEKYYSLSLVIENEKGEQIPLGILNSKSNNWVFSYEDAELYKKKFGVENWQSIIEGKVSIGMTKEMCELSWGKPKSINETIASSQISEQWVYSDNYLYFEDGILTVIQ